MSRNALNKYKQASVNTKSRGRILLMLYDGAIRFLEQAKLAMDRGQPSVKGEKISRAHAIISELNVSLDHSVATELCGNLEALYMFMLDQLSEANKNNNVDNINVVIELLDGLRDSWRQVVLGPEATTRLQGGAMAPVVNPISSETVATKG